ncbi:MAG: fumarylacetoacetate hydrolase family protein [Acidobacteria bacterium]|nr:fumarylacetoacetate hydrolase family protein [Acidobacteriota bacterium]
MNAILMLSAALMAAVPETPETPFKLATIEVGGKGPVLAMLLDQDRVIVEIATANAYVTRAAKLKAVKFPGEMRDLIEQYPSVRGRLYQIANYLKREGKPAFAHESTKVKYLAPVKYPWNLLAAAANYRAHAEGMGARPMSAAAAKGGGGGGFNAAAAALIDPDRDAPIFFAKSPRSCIIDPGSPYFIAEGRGRVDWEGEMAIVMGKTSYQLTKENSHDAVFGYSILFDLSDRGGRRREQNMFPGANWFEGKSTDRGAPFGPVIVPKEFLPNYDRLKIVTRVNGVVKQDGTTAELLWKEHHMLMYLTSILTLYPGDVIATGTPSGTGMERQEFLKAGDMVTIEIEGIGKLETPFQSAAQRGK